MGPLGAANSKLTASVIDAVPDLSFGAQGDLVSALRQKLADAGEKVKVDNDWGE